MHIAFDTDTADWIEDQLEQARDAGCDESDVTAIKHELVAKLFRAGTLVRQLYLAGVRYAPALLLALTIGAATISAAYAHPTPPDTSAPKCHRDKGAVWHCH